MTRLLGQTPISRLRNGERTDDLVQALAGADFACSLATTDNPAPTFASPYNKSIRIIKIISMLGAIFNAFKLDD
jgi:hypothetical protein